MHAAKAAASVDQLCGGRLVLGVASGDRPVEFPAFDVDHERRADPFREHVDALRRDARRVVPGADVTAGVAPRRGRRTQARADGSRSSSPARAGSPASGSRGTRTAGSPTRAPWAPGAGGPRLAGEVAGLQRPGAFLPFVQSLYIDLADASAPCRQPIHLGFRAAAASLELLAALRTFGANHVILNLKYGRRPAAEVLDEVAEFVLPEFPAQPPAAGSRMQIDAAAAATA